MATKRDDTFAFALALTLIACACDAGARQRSELCVPQEVGPTVYVTHSDRGHFTLEGSDLLDEIKRHPSSSETDDRLWLLVGAYCRPCTLRGEARRIDEMFPAAYIPEAVAAGCFSLTLADGRIVYGDLRAKLHISTSTSRSQ